MNIDIVHATMRPHDKRPATRIKQNLKDYCLLLQQKNFKELLQRLQRHRPK